MKETKTIVGVFENQEEREELIEWIIRKIRNASDRHLKIVYNFIWGLLS